uniref:Uncharacterized protein n=1 Tax=Eutreptiella gymnastica TaxID=73025 RepID=A0A7S1I899_9EUGL|mmetsp:Transcript_138016/g.239953  ORF Transcript_138016/g.239953 Transcript_138016/m.239953 type:complete len:121 (+) Transcript_138016:976-1338(+)
MGSQCRDPSVYRGPKGQTERPTRVCVMPLRNSQVTDPVPAVLTPPLGVAAGRQGADMVGSTEYDERSGVEGISRCDDGRQPGPTLQKAVARVCRRQAAFRAPRVCGEVPSAPALRGPGLA